MVSDWSLNLGGSTYSSPLSNLRLFYVREYCYLLVNIRKFVRRSEALLRLTTNTDVSGFSSL